MPSFSCVTTDPYKRSSFVYLASPVVKAIDIGYRPTPSVKSGFIKQFGDGHGRVDAKKLLALKARYGAIKRELLSLVKHPSSIESTAIQGDLQWRDLRRLVEIVNQVAFAVDKMRKAKTSESIYYWAQHLLLFESLFKQQTDFLPNQPKQLNAVRWEKVVLKKGVGQFPATNLVDPQTRRYINSKSIHRLTATGLDISRFDPADSSLWSRPPIDSREVEASLERQKGVMSAFFYDDWDNSIGGGGVSLFVRQPNKGKDQGRIVLGLGSNTAITTSRIATLLGYQTLQYLYLKDIKLYLDQGNYLAFQKELNKRSADAKIDQLRLIKAKGRDQLGEYLIIKDGVYTPYVERLIALPPSLLNTLGFLDRREVRGLYVLMMWLSFSPDEQSKLGVSLSQNLPASVVLHRLFGSLGNVEGGNQPDALGWNLIDPNPTRANVDRVILNFPFEKKNSGVKPDSSLTYMDFKWIVRYIALIRRQDLAAILNQTTWPEAVERLYLEKLIHRRNQLVRAAGLNGELQPDGNRINLWTEVPVSKFAIKGFVDQGKLTHLQRRDLPPLFYDGVGKQKTNRRANKNLPASIYSKTPYIRAYTETFSQIIRNITMQVNRAKGYSDYEQFLSPNKVARILYPKFHYYYYQPQVHFPGIKAAKSSVRGFFEYVQANQGNHLALVLSLFFEFPHTTSIELTRRLAVVNAMLKQPEFIKFSPGLYPRKSYGTTCMGLTILLRGKLLRCLLAGSCVLGNKNQETDKNLVPEHPTTLETKAKHLLRALAAGQGTFFDSVQQWVTAKPSQDFTITVQVSGDYFPFGSSLTQVFPPTRPAERQ